MSNDVTEINLKMMRTFVTLIECDGNASTAAKRLGISQPLMSQRLATLQHNHPTMRFAWLQKDGKTWSTTMAGRRVLPAIEEIVRLSRLVQEDTNLSIDRSPPVTIACGQLAATTFVRSAMMAFRKRHPGVLVRICTPRGAQRVEGVETGIFDLAMVYQTEGDLQQRYGRPISVMPLKKDPWMLVCSKRASGALKEQFIALPKRLKVSHLRDVPLIVPDTQSTLRRQLASALIDAGHSPQLRIMVETGGWSTIMRFAEDGFACALVTEMALTDPSKFLPVRPIETRVIPTPKLHLIHRTNTGSADPGIGPLAMELKELLVAELA